MLVNCSRPLTAIVSPWCTCLPDININLPIQTETKPNATTAGQLVTICQHCLCEQWHTDHFTHHIGAHGVYSNWTGMYYFKCSLHLVLIMIPNDCVKTEVGLWFLNSCPNLNGDPLTLSSAMMIWWWVLPCTLKPVYQSWVVSSFCTIMQ